MRLIKILPILVLTIQIFIIDPIQAKTKKSNIPEEELCKWEMPILQNNFSINETKPKIYSHNKQYSKSKRKILYLSRRSRKSINTNHLNNLTNKTYNYQLIYEYKPRGLSKLSRKYRKNILHKQSHSKSIGDLSQNTLNHPINDNESYNYNKLDPWEKRNKKIMRANMFLFRNTMLPFIYLIDAWIPSPIRQGFVNFTHNFLEPKNYIVYKLSGKHEQAKITAERFFTNTFLGGGGIINAAQQKWGNKYTHHNEPFDYIFYNKKINPGRYLILPIANQYYEREFAADLMHWLVNPIFYFTFPYNYIYYFGYRSCLLTNKKQTLFHNRKYEDSTYNNLRDLSIYEVLNYDQ